MATFKPLILDRDQDIKKLMTQLYRFSEDLKFTFSSLELKDNLSKETLDVLQKRGDRVKKLYFDTDKLQISFDDYGSDVHTSLTQSEDSIKLLVSKGKVVETMLSRMELYGESISLKTGQVVIQANNMMLNKLGDANFSGKIIGSAININGRFIVYPNGDCYIDDSLTTETLNPSNGIYAAELEVYNDNEYINQITGRCSSGSLWITTRLLCRRVRYSSDRRLKKDITSIPDDTAADVVGKLRPIVFTHKSGKRAVGYKAQDLYRIQEDEDMGMPLVYRKGRYLRLPYANYGSLYAGAIQNNQKRIERLKERIGGLECHISACQP